MVYLGLQPKTTEGLGICIISNDKQDNKQLSLITTRRPRYFLFISAIKSYFTIPFKRLFAKIPLPHKTNTVLQEIIKIANSSFEMFNPH